VIWMLWEAGSRLTRTRAMEASGPAQSASDVCVGKMLLYVITKFYNLARSFSCLIVLSLMIRIMICRVVNTMTEGLLLLLLTRCAYYWALLIIYIEENMRYIYIYIYIYIKACKINIFST